MAYKKISGNEFIKDVIDFELKKFGIGYDYLMSLPEMPLDESKIDPNVEYRDRWFQRYCFDSFEEFLEWKIYFFEHFKDYAPKRDWKRKRVEDSFGWMNLMYGLKTNYDFDLHMKKCDDVDVYDMVYGKNREKKTNKK